MKIIKATFLIFAIALFLSSCITEKIDNPDSTLSILNGSDNSVVLFYQNNNPGDTSLSNFRYVLSPQNAYENTITAMDTFSVRSTFKKKFETYPNKVLMIYIFSLDTINKVSWETIRDKYLVLKRYDLTLDSLEKKNWLVKYP